jgi:uncharacterized protein (DUF1330 family)
LLRLRGFITGIIVGSSTQEGRDNMKTRSTAALSMLAGIAIGAVAIQGLHAQAKPKAYTVTELQTLDAKAAADVAKRIQAAQTSAGGRNFRTGGGKVVGMEGPPPPQRVAITEWDSLEKAEAFFKWCRSGSGGNSVGVVSVLNLESSGVGAPEWRPRHDKRYHEV